MAVQGDGVMAEPDLFRILLRKEMKMKTVSRIAVFHLTIVGEVAVRRYQLDQVWGAFFDGLPLGSP